MEEKGKEATGGSRRKDNSNGGVVAGKRGQGSSRRGKVKWYEDGHTSLLRVERLSDVRQQVRRAAARALGVGHEVRLLGRKPFVLQCLRSGRPRRGVDRQACRHELARSLGHVRPVLRCIFMVRSGEG